MAATFEKTGTILARDGTQLFFREWLVDSARGALVLVHGLGEHGGRYAHVALRLNALGISVRAHDARGHGRSAGRRASIGRANDLLDDLKLVFDDFAQQEKSTPFLLGHSLGGLVAARFATGMISPLRGLVLSSPALRFTLTRKDRLLLAVSSRLFPNLPVASHLNCDKLSHDPAVVAAYRSDALVHGVVTARLVRFMQSAARDALDAASRVATPVLLLVAGDDALVDASGSRAFFERLNEKIRTMHWYDQSYHEVFNESAQQRAIVLNDLSLWLDSQLKR